MKRIFNHFFVLLLIIQQIIFSGQVVASELKGSTFPDSGNVYEDLLEDYGLLGIASKFHIFSKGETIINCHCAGNLAVNSLDGKANFGTPIKTGDLKREIHYIKNVKRIASCSGIPDTNTRTTKFVVGENNELTYVNNGNSVAINGTKMDNLSKESFYQDNKAEYINFSDEFSRLHQVCTSLKNAKPLLTIDSNYFPDKNNRKIDLSEINSDVIYVNIANSVLELATPLYISNPNEKLVILNINGSPTKLNIQSQIKYNNRVNQETEYFKDANVIWNFGNEISRISVNAPFQGTVLAPSSDIDILQNLDGSIIGNNVTISAETHKWDPNPIPIEKLGSVQLKKVDSDDNKKVLAGAVFNLYDEKHELIREGLKTNEAGLLKVEGLNVGKYYFVETKAPEGYVLDKTPHHFEITGNEGSIITLEAKNKKLIEKLGSVQLKKVDSDDNKKVLAGAVFNLYDEKHELIREDLKTNEAGLLKVEGLNVGKYYFVETKAPEGYVLDKTPHHFEITGNEGSIITLEAKNKKFIEKKYNFIPRLGSKTEAFIMSIGILICVILLLYMIRVRTNK